MSLTGWPFFSVIVVFAGLSTLATLVLGRRLRRNRLSHWVARAGLLVSAQAGAVLLVLVLINNSGGFYTSWDDLTGGGALAAGPLTQGPGVAGPAPGRQAMPDAHQPRRLPGGQRFAPDDRRFRKTMLTGAASGVRGAVTVYTPPEYDDPAYAKHEFPVLMLLHGVPGTLSGWTGTGPTSMNVEGVVDPLIAAKKMPPTVLVVPFIGTVSSNTLCSDVPGRLHLDTWLTKDVRQMVLDNFRVSDSPDAWGAIGFSTGGFCAVKMAVQHPDLFHSAVSIAGDDFAGVPKPFGGDVALQERNSPLPLLRKGPPPPVSLLLMATEDDKDCPASLDRELESAASAPTVVAHQYAAHGGHTGSVWKKFQPAAFSWLGQHLHTSL